MHKLIQLNTNILETNLINILLLIALLFYVYQSSFSVTLKERQNEIFENLEKINKDLKLSETFYEKSQQKLSFLSFYLQEWKAFYQTEKNKSVKEKYENIKENLEEIFLNTENLVKSLDRKTKINIEKYLVFLASGKLLRKFFFLSKDKKAKIIKQIICNLDQTIGK